MGNAKNSEKTRGKIINAAGQLFAERGINGVTVRDIVKQADTHLSALNYHFKSKEDLYREVLLEACQHSCISQEDQNYLESVSPEKALQVLVKEALKMYSKKSALKWQLEIIDRECWDPSPVFQEVVDHYFKPETEFISQILGRIVNKPPESDEIRFATIGLVGMLSMYGSYTHFIDAVAPGLQKTFKKKDWLEKHIILMVLEAANS